MADALTFSPAEELAFLSAQCRAQASGNHRDQDREFIRTLAGQLFSVGGCATLDFIARAIAELADPKADLPAQLTRIASASRAMITLSLKEGSSSTSKISICFNASIPLHPFRHVNHSPSRTASPNRSWPNGTSGSPASPPRKP